MKISNRTHPILEKLAKKELGNCDIYTVDQQLFRLKQAQIRDHWRRVSVGVNNQIYILSKAFIDAYEAAGDKLYESGLFGEVEDDNICIIHPDFYHPEKQGWLVLKIRNNINDKMLTVDAFTFRGGALTDDSVYYFDYSGGFPEVQQWMTNFVSQVVKSNYKYVLNGLLITLFIKYANVETKHLKAGQREKGIECKYVNDSKVPVTFMDSKWFTTLVKSDGFKVRGHFRLQPHGEGMKQRKLIWINDFMKDGYTAPARKLSQEA